MLRLGDERLGRARLHQPPQVHHRERRRSCSGRSPGCARRRESRCPSRARRSRIRFRTALCTETSSDDVISSAIRTSGRTASARASATRWRCPPERRLGSSRVTAGSRWTSSSSSSTSFVADGARRAPPGAGGLGDRRAHGHPRVERGEWILEDHLHAAIQARRRVRCALPRRGAVEQAPPHRRSGRARRSPGQASTCPSRTRRRDRRSSAPAPRGRRRRPP